MSSPPNNIANVRRRRKLSQQQLAEKVGAHAITISNLERGEAPLTNEWLDRLSAVLQVNPGALLLYEKPMKVFLGGALTSQSLDISKYQDLEILPTAYAANRPIPADIPMWVVIEDNSLYPIFRQGDVVRIFPIIETDDEELAWAEGRLGIVTTKDGTAHVGYLAQLSRTSASVDAISGPPIRNIELSTIFIIDRAIFSAKFEVRPDRD